MLGEIPHQNRSIEIQVMDRFIRESKIMSFLYPELYYDNFKDIMPHQNVSNVLDLELTAEYHVSNLTS